MNETVTQLQSMVDRQLTQLIRLVDDLLDISRVTSGKLELRITEMALQTIIHSAVEMSRPVIDESQLELICVMPDAAVVDTDTRRMSLELTAT